MNGYLGQRRVIGEQRGAGVVQERRLFQRVDAGDGVQVGNLGEGLAVARLQAADKVPADGARQQLGLLGELLGVVFAKVRVLGGGLVQRENVIGRLELGDGYEADLVTLVCLEAERESYEAMQPLRGHTYITPAADGRDSLPDRRQL